MFLFSSILDQIVPDDDSTFITMENKTQVETAILAARDHAKMRMRKRKEEESYRIAREAVFSWKTERSTARIQFLMMMMMMKKIHDGRSLNFLKNLFLRICLIIINFRFVCDLPNFLSAFVNDVTDKSILLQF